MRRISNEIFDDESFDFHCPFDSETFKDFTLDSETYFSNQISRTILLVIFA